MYTEALKRVEEQSSDTTLSDKSVSEIRALFPYLKNQTYLNHAATGPLPTPVLEAVNRCLKERSEGHIEYWPDGLDARAEFKERVGRLINGLSANIAVSDSTSMALNWLARGVQWQAGDRILLNDLEFPSNVNPFLALEEQGVIIDFVKADNGCITVADIERALHPQTRLVSLSFVQFLNGFRSDLETIGNLCRERDVIFCVDGIQGLGALRLDVEKMNIDFLAAGGQKWLMWPRGTAFFYVSPRILDSLKPMATGWLSVEEPWTFFQRSYELLPDAGRFEPGIFNVLGVVGANESLKLMEKAGFVQIEERVLEHSRWLSEQLLYSRYQLFSINQDEHRSGIVTFYHDQAEALLTYMQQHRLFVSMRDGKIRLSPHFYNTREELEQFMQLLNSFRKSEKK
ncbi:MAG: aminotransferase class V-fold PLP-dependent enzyme [Calditrichota bacterium]